MQARKAKIMANPFNRASHLDAVASGHGDAKTPDHANRKPIPCAASVSSIESPGDTGREVRAQVVSMV